jgi:hypothetical protein
MQYLIWNFFEKNQVRFVITHYSKSIYFNIGQDNFKQTSFIQ